MKRTIVQPAILSGNALAEFKQWLGISRPSEDGMLEQLLHSGLELCEGFIRQMPIEAGCEEQLPPVNGWQCLDTQPVRAITGVSSLAAGGVRIPLAADAYEIDINAKNVGRVRVLDRSVEATIVVSFVAGIAPDWAALPDGLRQGIIRSSAYLYRDRDAARPNAPPASISALWLPWRRMRIV